MIYLGQLGRMVAIKCPSAQVSQSEDSLVFSTSLEGRRRAQALPRVSELRSWNLRTALNKPGDVAKLQAFVRGDWGAGPFFFVSADAPNTNLLDPQVASCHPWHALYAWTSAGGPIQTEEVGWLPQSYFNSDPSSALAFGATSYAVPVLPGQEVTGAAFVSGAGAYARLYFYDSSGATVVSYSSGIRSSGVDDVVRSWITREAPPNAVSCRVLAMNTVRAAGPTITWSEGLLPWADGEGCSQAVVHGASRDLLYTVDDRTFSALDYVVTEVG